jgi:hypothetical protein
MDPHTQGIKRVEIIRLYPKGTGFVPLADCWPRPQTPGALIVLSGLHGIICIGVALSRVPDVS